MNSRNESQYNGPFSPSASASCCLRANTSCLPLGVACVKWELGLDGLTAAAGFGRAEEAATVVTTITNLQAHSERSNLQKYR